MSEMTAFDVSTDPYDFHFVEVGKPSQKGDEDKRTVIRAHVMRDYYDKQNSNRNHNATRDIAFAASRNEDAVQHTHRFKVGPHGLQEVKKQKKRRTPQQQRWNAVESSTVLDDVADHSISGIRFVHKTAESFKRSKAIVASVAKVGRKASITESGQRVSAQVDMPRGELLVGKPQCNINTREVYPSSPMTELSAELADPFDSLPPSHSQPQRLHGLLQFASQGISSARVLGQLRTEWRTVSMEDPGLFNAILSHYSCGNFGPSGDIQDPMEALQFRMDAMNLINQRLESPESALSDHTIGAVASLGLWESTNGELDAVNTHMHGLKRMIDMRGGIKAAGINQYIARYALWSHLNCALALGVNPEILEDVEEEPADLDSPLNKNHSLYQFDASTVQQSPVKAGRSAILGGEIVDILVELRQLMNSTSPESHQLPKTKKQKIQDSDKVYRLERRLLILSNQNGPEKFLTSCCLATIIFLDHHLRDFAFSARLMNRMIDRLQDSIDSVLRTTSMHEVSYNTCCAILWVLSIGGIANVASKRQKGESYYHNLALVCDFMGFSKWEDVENILRSFLWSSNWSLYGQELWKNVEDFRWSKYTMDSAGIF